MEKNVSKHKLKKWFLENLKKEEQNIYIHKLKCVVLNQQDTQL